MPIVVCQFFYMPFVAIPSWHTSRWTSNLDVESKISYPAVVVGSLGTAPDPALRVRKPECTYYNSNGVLHGCDTSRRYIDHDLEYFIFNPLRQHHGDIVAELGSPPPIFILDVPFYC